MELKNLTLQVCDLAREVGAFILAERATFSQHDVETKSKNSLVSYVDKKAEEMIVAKLSTLLPEAGVLAEEGTTDKEGETFRWIIDPLDGTTNFIHAVPCFSVSIALLEDDELILGVVYEVNHNECFYAWKNGGAWLNGSAISVSANNKLENALVATGFPYHDYERLPQYIDLLQFFMHNTRGVRRIGSAAVDLAYVAAGRFGGFYEYGLNPWDVAAGALIVQEAGGKVCDFRGGNDYLFGDDIVATSNSLHPEFLGAVRKCFGAKA